MNDSAVLEDLATRVEKHIPLTRSLDFSFRAWRPGCALQVSAPLSCNYNDKGTFFAGSQSVLLTLSGWARVTLEAEARVPRADVVAVESHLKYLKPLTTDALALVDASEEALTQFATRLKAKGRARLAVTASLQDSEGVQCASFEAVYLARAC